MNRIEDIVADGYKLVQPTKSKETIGISTRAFYDNLEKYKWEKTVGARGAVYYKVPLSFIELYSSSLPSEDLSRNDVEALDEETDAGSINFNEQQFPPPNSADLISFMRDTLVKFDSLSSVITDLKVENSRYKLITDGKEREVEELKNEYFKQVQEASTAAEQLKSKAIEAESLLKDNEALLKQNEELAKQMEALQSKLQAEQKKSLIDKLFNR